MTTKVRAPITAEASAKGRVKTFPVIEIFGPTIQGEGAEAGVTTHFVRFGGCDFRCSWCDSMYAVDPEEVRSNASNLTAAEIDGALSGLGGSPDWVTLSGGNPALLQLQDLVDRLHERELKVSVETQGTRWRPWLASVDRLTVSPKPPSSGMCTDENLERLHAFMKQVGFAASSKSVLKIVCFDEVDLAWASTIAERYGALPIYLSAGTPVPAKEDIRNEVGDRYAWLCEAVSKDPELARAKVLPQLHVIAWKDERGV